MQSIDGAQGLSMELVRCPRHAQSVVFGVAVAERTLPYLRT
jgi:hypothetical protein